MTLDPNNQHHGDANDDVVPGLTAFYSRLTRDDVGKKSLSLGNQRKRFLELAGQRGWAPFQVFEEPKRVSGKLDEDHREALAALLADVRSGAVTRVVVRHLDRLGRGRVLEDLLDEMESRSISLWDFSGEVDYRSAAGRFQTRVQGAAGAFEVERGGERVREAKRGRARDGWYLGPAPFGYASQARLRRELTTLYGDDPEAVERARIEAQRRIPISPGLVIDEDEARVVREMFELLVERGWGPRRIATDLNTRGLLHRGGVWFPQTAAKILKDPKVAGFTHFDEAAYSAKRPSSARIDRQTRFAAKHDAIIEPELWSRAQEVLAVGAARMRSRSSPARPYPLTGYLVCANGHAMKGHSSEGARHAYYRCGARARNGEDHPTGGCSADPIPADLAERAVRQVLAELLGSVRNVVAVVEEANRQLTSGAPAARKAVQEIDAEIREVQLGVERLLRVIEGSDDADAAKAVFDRVIAQKGRIKVLEVRRREAEVVVPLPRRVSPAEVESYLASLTRHLSHDPAGTANLLRALAADHGLRIVVADSRTVRVELALDPDRLGSTRQVRLAGRQRQLVPITATASAPAKQTVDEWVTEQQGKHLCRCGCEQPIEVLPKHHAPGVGIPKFIQGHHKVNMTAFVEQVNGEGFLTVSQAAAELGVGTTTLRRLEERGLIVTERRAWGDREPMRLFDRQNLPALRVALKDAGFRFDVDGTWTTARVADALGVAQTTIRAWERDGTIQTASRDTCGRRVYVEADVEQIRAALAALEVEDQRLLDAEGLVSRMQAQELLGIGNRSIQKMISTGNVTPEWRVLASSARKVQVFPREEIQRLVGGIGRQ